MKKSAIIKWYLIKLIFRIWFVPSIIVVIPFFIISAIIIIIYWIFTGKDTKIKFEEFGQWYSKTFWLKPFNLKK